MRIILLTLLLIVFNSCEREDYQLQRQMDKIIAKESRKQIDSLKAVMDSICDADYERHIHVKLDSMIPVRIEEIRKKLNIKTE